MSDGAERRGGEGGGADAPASGGGAPGPTRTAFLAGGIVLLVAVGLVLGAFHPAPHTGGDNAGYLSLAYSLLGEGAYLDLYLPGDPIHTKYPPGFPLLLAGAALLGARTWTAFKAVVAVSAVLAVLVVFLWGRERWGAVPAALAAGVVAVSSALIYYSHWILSDVPFLVLTFLSLWALARAERPVRGKGGARPGRSADAEPSGSSSAAGRSDGPGPSPGWVALGCAAAVAAYFTRSAGLPLVVAVAGWLALRRWWKTLAGYAAGFGVPALLWLLRGLSRPDTYVAEFWLVNPYEPDRGTVGVADLLSRVGINARDYVTAHLPGGITGLEGTSAAAVGVALVGLAAVGWGLRVRRRGRRLGVAELFLPLYGGLLLVWPEVWSGDRFALPLLPLLVVYAGAASVEGGRRLAGAAGGSGEGRSSGAAGVGGAVAATVGLLVLVVPALSSWSDRVREARSCAAVAEARGPWACAGPAMTEFVAAAGWSGANLPDGSVVFSRKPRFFYLAGGVDSETFPLSPDVERFFREARRLGAGYVLVDRLDGLASYYVGSVVRERPAAFCAVAGFGSDGEGAQLLGVLPGESAASGGDAPSALSRCPEGTVRGRPGPTPDYSSSVVPLFGRTGS